MHMKVYFTPYKHQHWLFTEQTIQHSPFEHGLALIDEIPNSVLLTLKGRGHENHPDDWESIINAVSKHTSKI